MNKDHDATRPLRRPPYGMLIRPRIRRDTPTSLAWRKYSPPAAPQRSSSWRLNRAAKVLLWIGSSTCAAFAAWSIIGSALSSSGVDPAPMATPPPVMPQSPPTATTPRPSPTFSVRSPVRSSPAPKQSKAKTASSPRRRERPATRSGSSRPARRDVEPRPVPRRTPKVRRATPERDAGERTQSLIAARCDKLFPPTVSKFRIRNWACHRLLS